MTRILAPGLDNTPLDDKAAERFIDDQATMGVGGISVWCEYDRWDMVSRIIKDIARKSYLLGRERAIAGSSATAHSTGNKDGQVRPSPDKRASRRNRPRKDA